MIEWMQSAYELFLTVMDTLPAEWRVACTGIVACLLLTQYAKRYLPSSWTPKERSLASEITGFAIGAFIVHTFDPSPQWDRTLHAVIVGMTGPLVYRILIAVTSRRWPFISEALSKDP